MQGSRGMRLRFLILLWASTYSHAQETYADDNGGYNGYDQGGGYGESYQDYAGDSYDPQDNIYADYAARQEMKEGGGGGIGMGTLIMSGAVSWYLGGKYHSGRAVKKVKAKHRKEQKALYTQYYNDVYKLSEQNQELAVLIEQLQDLLKETEAKHELEALQRDYDEFKQPDIDGDDKISRSEFNMYVKNYLSNYPGLSESDYPKFEDFDQDGDGYVSFSEYSKQMAIQTQKAEKEALHGDKKSQTKAKALRELL